MLRLLETVFLFVSFQSDLVGSGKTTCTDGWLPFQGSCYLFGHNAVHFTEAEHFCQQHGNSHLIHVNSKLENDFIKDKLREFPANNWWLGATDEDIEGDWKWVDNDERVNFTDWYPGQDVNNYEDCGVFWYGFDFKWGDYICTASVNPVCETAGSACVETEILG